MNGEWKKRERSFEEEKRGEKRNGVWWRGRGGNHSIVSAEGKRYEYSNFTPLIRDGCLFLWGTALLVFVSSLIICMMYSTALYSVMGERWRSGRLTMRPKGRRGRHSQLYSMQRSKATLLYPKLVTISQLLKLPSNNSTYLHSTAPKQGYVLRGWALRRKIAVLGQQPITNHEPVLPTTQEVGLYNSFWMTQKSQIIWLEENGCSWTPWTTLPVGSQSRTVFEIHPVNVITIRAGRTNDSLQTARQSDLF